MPSLAAVLLAALASTAEEPKSALRLLDTIALPSVQGRIDHLALDRRRNRLFVAALGNGTLEVVDLDAKKVVKGVKGLAEPQGVLCLEEEGKVCVANGGSGSLDVFDASSLEKVASVKVGDDADNVRFDPGTKLVYVGYGDGALAVVDAKTWKVAGEIRLPGHPESFQLDVPSKRAFVNVPSKHEIEVVDLEMRKISAVWPVREAGQNFPMAILLAERRLFIACRSPAKLLVLDTDGRSWDALELSGDADDIFLDEARGRLFVSCGEGLVDVFRRNEGGQYPRVERFRTAAGARTCLYAPGEEKLYLAVPRRGDQGAEIRIYDTRP
jgi:hypothetical protein